MSGLHKEKTGHNLCFVYIECSNKLCDVQNLWLKRETIMLMLKITKTKL